MINMTTQGRSLIVEIMGDIDHHTAETLRLQIETAYVRERVKYIILDFKLVTFMDSSGIGMVIGRYKDVQKQGGRLIAANVNANVNRIFELSGLPKIIPVYDSIESALKEANG